MSRIPQNGWSIEFGGEIVDPSDRRENLVERKVTYTLMKDDQLYVIENVPARVNVDTGEEFFSPQTVERLHHIILEKHQPKRFIQAPVFDFR